MGNLAGRMDDGHRCPPTVLLTAPHWRTASSTWYGEGGSTLCQWCMGSVMERWGQSVRYLSARPGQAQARKPGPASRRLMAAPVLAPSIAARSAVRARLTPDTSLPLMPAPTRDYPPDEDGGRRVRVDGQPSGRAIASSGVVRLVGL